MQHNRIWLCVATSSMPQTKYIATQYPSRHLMRGLVDASASRFCAMLESRRFRELAALLATSRSLRSCVADAGRQAGFAVHPGYLE